MCDILNNHINALNMHHLNDNLYNVKKGVYLMGAKIHLHNEYATHFFGQNDYLYRFGIIGENDGNNNANKRLAQCTNGWRRKNHLNFGDRQLEWKYSYLIQLQDDFSADLLKLIESVVRVYIYLDERFLRFSNNDAFISSLDNNDVCQAFSNILINQCNLIIQ